MKLRLRDLGKIWVSGFGPWERAAASSTVFYFYFYNWFWPLGAGRGKQNAVLFLFLRLLDPPRAFPKSCCSIGSSACCAHLRNSLRRSLKERSPQVLASASPSAAPRPTHHGRLTASRLASSLTSTAFPFSNIRGSHLLADLALLPTTATARTPPSASR